MNFETGIALGAALGVVVTLLLRWIRDRRTVEGAAGRARELIRGAEQEAENLRKAAELAAKDEALTKKEAMEAERAARTAELRDEKTRLLRKEEGLDRKAETLERREDDVAKAGADARSEAAELRSREKELDALFAGYGRKVERLAGITVEDARALVMDEAGVEAEAEAERVFVRRVERAKREAESRARDIVVTAIQRVAVDHCAESTVSVLELPGNEMKGRIIGREGRNIRAFEKATGVDVVIDDTPGVVSLSAFDPVRRETAFRALTRLVQDGRIHPARIEDVVEEVRGEVEEFVFASGEDALAELDLHGVHPNLVTLLGRLRFRTSYGQNVLRHVVECAHLAGLIAAELSLDPKLAKRCALLHDIGKAVSHEVEGGHVEVAVELARRLGEPPEVVNAIAAHHEDTEATSHYGVITQIVDAISSARPGARRETLERYLKRMRELEEVATSFPGVKNAYAIHAGREVRVIVNPQMVSDPEASRLSREIARAVEDRLTVPSEVKVTVLRETRAVDYAR
ncbi:MAG: ribonuclease Y [Planctomycetota bacterium]